MLLSLRYRFLFVHIAKTGGTSIRDTLKRHSWQDPYRIPQFLCSRLSAWSGHRIAAKLPRHAKAVAALEMLPRELYQQLFKFTIVRNPWDLQVSSYHHLRRERPHLFAHVADFPAFVRWKLDPARPYQFHADTASERQSDYIVDLHGQVIVDYVGHYESLQDDFAVICQRVGIQPPALQHKRQAKDRKRDYREYYDDATAERIQAHYQRDIEQFGYCFDRPDEYRTT